MKDILYVASAIETKMAIMQSKLREMQSTEAHQADLDLDLALAPVRLHANAPTPSNSPSSVCRAPDGKESELEAVLLDALEGRWQDAGARSKCFLKENGQWQRSQAQDLYDLTSMDKTLIISGLAIGMLGAILPSVSLGEDGASVRDMMQSNQDGLIKDGVELLLRTSSAAPMMDVAGGSLHRFASGGSSHDLLPLLVKSMAQAFGVPQAVAEPALRILAHLIIDAFGATGIPVPGSSYLMGFIEQLFGEAVGPKMHSRLGSFRWSDLISTGSTSALLFLHSRLRGLEEIDNRLVATIAHGTTTVAILGLAQSGFLHVAARRSLINYSSAALFVKNALQLKGALGERLRQHERVVEELHKVVWEMKLKTEEN